MKSHMSRFLSLILALALSFSLCVPAFAVNEFADVSPDYWAYGDIMACVEAGTVNGVGEGKFDPEGQVTDIQFLVMLTRTFYADEAEAAKATETSNWYAPYLKAASDAAIDRRLTIQDQALDRYNMASVLFYVLMEKDLLYTTTYEAIKSAENLTDWDTMPDPNINHIFVQYCYAHGILAGMSDGAFHGEQTMTRAQACAVLVRMIKLLNGETLPQPTTPAQPQQPTQPEQPQQPTTPTQPEQPQQPETPDQTDNGTLANGEPATEANVTAMLNELKKKYPAGTAWGESTMYKTPSANAKSAIACIGANASPYYACGGFAAMVSDTIFSNNAYSEITDISKVRPGDFVAKFDKAGAIKHIAIVTNTIAPGKSGNANTDRWKVCICDGNVNGGYVDWAGSYGVFGCGKSNANPYTGEYYRFATRY